MVVLVTIAVGRRPRLDRSVLRSTNGPVPGIGE
jgi:hypothetical protein